MEGGTRHDNRMDGWMSAGLAEKVNVNFEVGKPEPGHTQNTHPPAHPLADQENLANRELSISLPQRPGAKVPSAHAAVEQLRGARSRLCCGDLWRGR